MSVETGLFSFDEHSPSAWVLQVQSELLGFQTVIDDSIEWNGGVSKDM